MTTPAEVFSGTPVVAGYVPPLVRRTTLPIAPVGASANERSVTVPEGHWYRVIYGATGWLASAVVADRNINFFVLPPQGFFGANLIQIGAPGPVQASQSAQLLFGPTLTSYTAVVAGVASMQFPIPDLLWPARTKLSIFVTNVQAGDTFTSGPGPVFMIEDYIEHAPAAAVVAAPLPLG